MRNPSHIFNLLRGLWQKYYEVHDCLVKENGMIHSFISFPTMNRNDFQTENSSMRQLKPQYSLAFILIVLCFFEKILAHQCYIKEIASPQSSRHKEMKIGHNFFHRYYSVLSPKMAVRCFILMAKDHYSKCCLHPVHFHLHLKQSIGVYNSSV